MSDDPDAAARDLATFPYVFRWNRHGCKGQPCRVTARSLDRRPGIAPLPGAIAVRPKAFNSIRIEFVDRFVMVTSGNAIRKAKPNR